MANIKKKVPENVVGEFYVDSTCIDCDTCRQIAPQVFSEAASTAYVHHQPDSAAGRDMALRALVCCPTGSIGSLGDARPQSVMDDFPLLIEEPVSYCGFNSPKSFGGNSYFVKHDKGNWLIDSPKFLPRLVQRLRSLGGIANIFLTHRDDVADAERYAKEFGSTRFIHRNELSAQPGAEVVLEGNAPVELASGFLSIPTPGHTSGHCVLLLNDRFLFTGDHLDFDRHERRLSASYDYCWHSWSQQIESMQSLSRFAFEWVLPGHGQRIHLASEAMKGQMAALVERMRAGER
jgi:glyoxylase-like metal-dependent hydrolase (beta-lactamase superfamily II)/ferredoxin